MYFCFQLLYSLALFFKKYLLVLCWNSQSIYPLFSPIQLAFLLLLLWTHYQVNYLLLFYQDSFQVISWFLKYIPLSSPFFLTFSVSRKLGVSYLDSKAVLLCDNVLIHSVTTTEWIKELDLKWAWATSSRECWQPPLWFGSKTDVGRTRAKFMYMSGLHLC